MHQKMIYAASLIAMSISSAIFADQCASVTTANNDVAVLNQQIAQNCTGNLTYKIGDLYPNTGTAEGVVIYAQNGQGIAVALTDQIDPLTSSGSTYDSSNNASNYGASAEYLAVFGGSYTGLNSVLPSNGNTHAIINGQYCTSNMNCAAYAAYHYQGPSGTDPLGTWYLPSKEELTMVLSLDDSITAGNIASPAGYSPLETAITGGACANFGGCIYWSSTELSGVTNSAWLVNSTLGYVFHYLKNNQFGVRAVRAFTY